MTPAAPITLAESIRVLESETAEKIAKLRAFDAHFNVGATDHLLHPLSDRHPSITFYDREWTLRTFGGAGWKLIEGSRDEWKSAWRFAMGVRVILYHAQKIDPAAPETVNLTEAEYPAHSVN